MRFCIAVQNRWVLTMYTHTHTHVHLEQFIIYTIIIIKWSNYIYNYILEWNSPWKFWKIFVVFDKLLWSTTLQKSFKWNLQRVIEPIDVGMNLFSKSHFIKDRYYCRPHQLLITSHWLNFKLRPMIHVYIFLKPGLKGYRGGGARSWGPYLSPKYYFF